MATARLNKIIVMSRVYRDGSMIFSNYQPYAAPVEHFVHCPVCSMSYSPQQTDAHILKHTLATNFNSTIVPTPQQPSYELVSYPMIEPLEFEVSQFARKERREEKPIISFDYSERNRRPAKIIEMVDRQTQTVNRPFLQEQRQERDLYNCLDGFFNGDSFKYEDVVGKNVGLASKRHLTEWEEARLQM